MSALTKPPGAALVPRTEAERLLKAATPLLDVRSEIEFAEGHPVGAVNIPLLTTEERVQVGTCYREKGSAAAVALGHALVNGPKKESRVRAWSKFFKDHPTGLLYCARGGMRSEITQSWLAETGCTVPRLQGGYKTIRRALINVLIQAPDRYSWIVISGRTGSGKTRLLQALAKTLPSVIDLEQLANHRGSAFGGQLNGQPAQATFENALALRLLQLDNQKPLIVEDESRMVGHCAIPLPVFDRMSIAPVLVLELPLEDRARQIIEEYVLQAAEEMRQQGTENVEGALADRYLKNLFGIRKKLGDQRTKQISAALVDAFKGNSSSSWEVHREWVEPLLRYYYDPYYDRHLEKLAPRVIERGSADKLRSKLSEMYP